MLRLVCLAAVAMLALSASAKANVIANFGPDPTSAAGAFNHSPPAGPFDDQYTFSLVGGPAFITIASVTNTFAAPSDFIANFVGSVVFEGADGVIGGGDDVTVIGPVSASACVLVPNCQGFAGTAILSQMGNYYLDISGIAGSTAGYGGNLSVAAVPGPLAGVGLPGLVAALLGVLGWRRRRSVQ